MSCDGHSPHHFEPMDQCDYCGHPRGEHPDDFWPRAAWPTEPIDGTRNDRALRPLLDLDYEPVTESELRLMDGNR